jgi:hypothetical protein
LTRLAPNQRTDTYYSLMGRGDVNITSKIRLRSITEPNVTIFLLSPKERLASVVLTSSRVGWRRSGMNVGSQPACNGVQGALASPAIAAIAAIAAL